MKTGDSQRSRCRQKRPDNAKTRSSQEPATINQQPSTIRGEAHKDQTAADGGTATFIGFDRAAHRLFGKAQSLLPDDYHTRLILPRSVGHPRSWPTWRERRSEYRLIVTHNTPTPPPPYLPADTPN